MLCGWRTTQVDLKESSPGILPERICVRDVFMVTESTKLEPRGIGLARAAGDAFAASAAKTEAAPDADRLRALRGELEEERNHWTEQVAAMVEEDYRQLMADLDRD
jgi:hypothetical protein